MAESISFDYSNAMFMVDDADIATMKEKVLGFRIRHFNDDEYLTDEGIAAINAYHDELR